MGPKAKAAKVDAYEHRVMSNISVYVEGQVQYSNFGRIIRLYSLQEIPILYQNGYSQVTFGQSTCKERKAKHPIL